MDTLDLVGDDIEVLGRVQRNGDPGQGADGLGPLAGAVDDDTPPRYRPASVRTPVARGWLPRRSSQDVGHSDALVDAHPS
jgi:hypothetical protein